jgi:predicted pyridoxine 5'-phosphate oxidase superfamily flavin-nucleotide-binding protein
MMVGRGLPTEMPRSVKGKSISRRRTPDVQGERDLQQQYGTTARAGAFYTNQMLDHLNEGMQNFVRRMELVFISTADAHGDCDSSFRAGPSGFVRILSDKTLAYPEYRGNGVMASLGNMRENRHVGLLFLDFFRDKIGLHVNGSATMLSPHEFSQRVDAPPEASGARPLAGPRIELWVVVEIDEAYIHCSKHIPLLRKLTAQETVAWGTDDAVAKGGDFFKVAAERRSTAA